MSDNALGSLKRPSQTITISIDLPALPPEFQSVSPVTPSTQSSTQDSWLAPPLPPPPPLPMEQTLKSTFNGTTNETNDDDMMPGVVAVGPQGSSNTPLQTTATTSPHSTDVILTVGSIPTADLANVMRIGLHREEREKGEIIERAKKRKRNSPSESFLSSEREGVVAGGGGLSALPVSVGEYPEAIPASVNGVRPLSRSASIQEKEARPSNGRPTGARETMGTDQSEDNISNISGDDDSQSLVKRPSSQKLFTRTTDFEVEASGIDGIWQSSSSSFSSSDGELDDAILASIEGVEEARKIRESLATANTELKNFKDSYETAVKR
jgi:hypothetical protein